MHSLLLNVSEQKEQPITLIRISGGMLSWIKFIVPVALVGGLLSFAVLFVGSRTVTISGKVVSANTKMPISDAMVAVESGMSNEETGLGSYVRTDSEGRFVANARGRVLLSAWKLGYALRSLSGSDVSAAKERDIIIELRELRPTGSVAEQDAFYKLKSGHGFSFSPGELVSATRTDADIVLVQNAEDPISSRLETQGEGGIIFQPFDDTVDFYNTPEAPSAGYQKQAYINRSQPGLYFVRTRDGKHYAKFRLLVDLVYPPQGLPYLDFESARLLWAYQPDGTRNLEVTPSKNFPFPVEKFGLKRESLPH